MVSSEPTGHPCGIPDVWGAALLQHLQQEPSFRVDLLAPLGRIAEVSARGGMRLIARNGECADRREPGSAPELRICVEAAGLARAEELLARGRGIASRYTEASP